MDKATADRIMELVKVIEDASYELGVLSGLGNDEEDVSRVGNRMKSAETELKLILYHTY